MLKYLVRFLLVIFFCILIIGLGFIRGINVPLAIISVIILLGICVYVDAEINWYMTQYALKSDRRTSKWIIEFYNYHKKRHPRLDEKQLLTHVIEVCFTISDRKPYQIRRHRFITRKEVEEIVEKSRDVEHLVDNVIKAGYSPDLTPW